MSDVIFAAAELLKGGDAFRVQTPPARLSVFGDPVAHSKSPGFHNAALRACGIDAQYVKIHVRPEDLTAALRALPAADFIGTNVTIPHKAGALATVDEAVDYAKKSGAVNTVVVQGNKLIGHNTDGPGLLRAIREEFSADVRDLRVMVLGAGGGAGRAISVQCAMAKCQRLVLVNRTHSKAQALAGELSEDFGGRLVESLPQEEAQLSSELNDIDLIINASSVGMKADDAALIPGKALNSKLMIYDTVYASGKSRLVVDAESVGARAANGLSMLLHQGALSFEIWFGRQAPLEAMRNALKVQS